MKFRPPQNVEDGLEFLSAVSLTLDLYMSRTQEWELAMLMTKVMNGELWGVIAKSIFTESGVSLEGVPYEELGVCGQLKAIGVFCQGLLELELPNIHKSFCAGITTEAILSMIRDLDRVREQATIEPEQVMSSLLSQVLARGI
ncbi:MAG: hypothetical protein ACRCVN_05970 [Spirochaetia bacterium]